MTVRDRIKRFERVKASDLLANPNNWREHPEAQANALAAILEDVGIAGALIARETPEGLELIDGHLRADSSPEVEWPVLVLDVDQAEADLLLASYDPLSAMAETNHAKLESLLDIAPPQSEALSKMFHDLNLIKEELANDETYTKKIKAPVYEPKGDKPSLEELVDRSKAQALIDKINESDATEDVKNFLRIAAERHTAFDFQKIAEFYCHANKDLQELMEQSGLVIIDFDKAIEYGFVNLSDRLGKLASLEESNGST